VICVALNYCSPDDLLKPPVSLKPWGRVADFAIYPDYHTFIKTKLFELADWLLEQIRPLTMKFKVCVDTAPLAEKALAQRAGLGFIGKNHVLISPILGAKLLLGELVTTLPLVPDGPVKEGCADCDRCVRACPTRALDFDGTFDARKCISYLTGEHDGRIPEPMATQLGDRVYRCDECVTACPYTRHSLHKAGPEFQPDRRRKWLRLDQVLQWSQEDFDMLFKDTPAGFSGLEKLKRNARVCLKNIRNTQDPTLF
jgi:epoxyqueuosine reductase